MKAIRGWTSDLLISVRQCQHRIEPELPFWSTKYEVPKPLTEKFQHPLAFEKVVKLKIIHTEKHLYKYGLVPIVGPKPKDGAKNSRKHKRTFIPHACTAEQSSDRYSSDLCSSPRTETLMPKCFVPNTPDSVLSPLFKGDRPGNNDLLLFSNPLCYR